MSAPRWTPLPDGRMHCVAHGETFKAPRQCGKCADDPGPAPADQPLAPVTFPDGCKSDDESWRELTGDVVAIDLDLKFFRRVRRQLVAKEPAAKVTGAKGERVKSILVLTDEIVSSLVSVGNLIVKLQDAKTKTIRAVIESAGKHRRDQRTKQMLEAKLRSTKQRRGAGN